MIANKHTIKAQTTVSRAACSGNLNKEVEGDIVTLSRAATEVAEDPFATFTEWNSEAERKAYADL